ncbi:MAG: type IV toxin-antitoxin system AbiEi family antitoxin domain-containing protein, partial [Ilumatobacteraceae bacterium]
MIIHPAVLQLFAGQHGVASTQQLGELSMSPSTIKRARRDGAIETVLPGIVQLAGTTESFDSRATALQLSVGGDVFISGFSAGVVHGLR